MNWATLVFKCMKSETVTPLLWRKSFTGRLRIIYAGADTQGQTVTTTDGNFSLVAGGERRPLLYLGYIVNEHYQSLLPVVEDDYVPPCLAQPAVDIALQNALQALIEVKTKQGPHVSS